MLETQSKLSGGKILICDGVYTEGMEIQEHIKLLNILNCFKLEELQLIT